MGGVVTPTLEVVTRHLATRPKALAHLQQTLAVLDGTAWTQTLIVDDVGRGTEWANLRLREVEPVGEWVWVMDDDNQAFIQAPFVSWLTGLPEDVDLVICLAHHGPPGVLPWASSWNCGLPPQGQIGSFNVLVRASLWRAARHAWTGRYEGDYDFIVEAWRQMRGVCWLPSVLCGVQRISHGAREDVA